MRLTTKILMAIFVFSAPGISHACICTDYKTAEENSKLYPFIAHVKIMDKQVKNDTIVKGKEMSIGYGHDAKLDIKIIEQFKGNAVATIKEYGIHTSCEVGVYAGEEWIMFALYDSTKKEYYIGGCFPLYRVRNRKEEKVWSVEHTLNSLRTIFKHSLQKPTEDGPRNTYYSTGQIESEAGYKQGELAGNRKIYFSDGKLWVDENFINGELHGSYKQYNNAGQLVEEAAYDNGKRLRSKKWEDFTVDPYSGHFIKTPEYKGQPAEAWLRYEFFWQDSSYSFYRAYFKSGVIEWETIDNYTASYSISTHYFKSGRINYRTVYDKKAKKEFYQQWDENGKLEMEREYLDGKMIRNSSVR